MLASLIVLAIPAGAQAKTDTWMVCRYPKDIRGVVFKQHPRNCIVARNGFVGVKLHDLHWHRWGKPRARAMGLAFRQPAHVLAYRKRRAPSCGPHVNRPPFYTRLRVRFGDGTTTYGIAPDSC